MAQAAIAQAPSDDPVFEPCLVKVKDEVEIPAQKEGTLIKLTVIEGTRVKTGDLLAVIDDREAQAAVKVARFGLQAAEERATDDIEERYAAKAAEVAKKDLEKDLDANQRHSGSVPDIEIIQKQLVVEKSDLQIEKAQKDQKLAGLDANTKQAELEAAKVALEKRTIVAPLAGEVVKLQRHQSEWVNPGDPILTLMRFETLYVEVFVPASRFDRNELLGKQVTVVIPRAHGREISLTGKVVHVGQVIESGGNSLVRAEVQNVPDGESWAIQPGMSPQGKMTILMK
jgi:multidrug efflux pump subunit AcrA (membrane-fusion protein)